MWVKGDLKDQLGISHRKARKNNPTASNLEAAPMFMEQHSRSISDIHTSYEPAMVNSPAMNSSLRQTYLDTPPMNETIELPPREPDVQYATIRDNPTRDTHLSPLPIDGRNFSSSPQPSYYSASDLPPASPLPSPKYRYPNGEITSTPPSRRTSIATSRAVSLSARGAPTAPMPIAPLPPQPQQQPQDMLAVPESPYGGIQMSDAAGYEMQVRSQQQYAPSLSPLSQPPSPYGHGHPRAPSEASYVSYATAASEFYTAEDGRGGSSVGHGQPFATSQPHPTLYPQQYHPQQSVYHPSLTPERESMEDDRATITADPRRASTASTWEGGRAL